MATPKSKRGKRSYSGLSADVYGIVSNGQGWVFYRWNAEDTEFGRTSLLGIDNPPRPLGALDYVCAACNRQVPVVQNGA